MKTLIPLRLIAIASNIAFITYGAAAGLTPILLLHSALLPLNSLRTVEQIRTFRRVRAMANGRVEVDALIPFMTVTTARAGEMLFGIDEEADKMYYIAKGTVRIPEIGKDLPAGTLFGEIGLFTADRVRTASARCVTDCTLQVISFDALQRACVCAMRPSGCF
jgi:CRP-like cAMP-binding protein